MDITIGGSGIDWPAWVQAVGSLIAVAVTALQWWLSHRTLQAERNQRIRHTQVLLGGIYSALRKNIAFLRAEYDAHGDAAAKAFAVAMLSGGTDLMERTLEAIDMSAVPPENLDGVMSATTCFRGIIQALNDLATNEKVDVAMAVHYLESTHARFREAMLLIKPRMPAEVLDTY